MFIFWDHSKKLSAAKTHIYIDVKSQLSLYEEHPTRCLNGTFEQIVNSIPNCRDENLSEIQQSDAVSCSNYQKNR